MLLNSDVLGRITVGLFPPEGPSAHVTALWRFHVVFEPPASNSCYFATRAELLPTWKRTILEFVRVLCIGVSNKTNHRRQLYFESRYFYLCCQPNDHFKTFQLSQLVLSLQFKSSC